MADGEPTGETAYGYLVTVAVAETIKLLARCYDLSVEFVPEIADEVNEVLIGLLRDVNEIAMECTALSEVMIMQKILETRRTNRPHQGIMESHIVSRPGPFGLVEVALLEELDKIVNPNGYGPYWRAQEYGTGTGEVPEQAGRVILGTFEPSGTPPQAAQRGAGKGTDLQFIPGGANPGRGVISVELGGRHFLRDGFAEVGEKYLAKMADVQAKWDARITAILAQLKERLRRGGGGFLGIIEG